MKRLLMVWLAILLLAGCAGPTPTSAASAAAPTATPKATPTPTPIPIVDSAVVLPIAESVVHAELRADVDGDGEEELLRLSSEQGRDGFALAPILTVLKEGEEIARQTLFEAAGLVRPYFGDCVDFDGDGRLDIHVRYESEYEMERQDYALLALDAPSLRTLSPEDAYRAAFYHGPDGVQATSLYDALEALVPLSAPGAERIETHYTNLRFEGPLAVTEIEGEQALRYRLIAYDFSGRVEDFTLLLRPDAGKGWEIADLRSEGSRTLTVLSGHINSADDYWLHAHPGWTITPYGEEKEAPTGLTMIYQNPHRRIYATAADFPERLRVVYDVDTATDVAIRLSIYGEVVDDTSHWVGGRSHRIALGTPLADVKALLGDAPYYEDENTLIYLREVDRQQYTKEQRNNELKLGYETLRFQNGGLVSLELALNTDYALVTHECFGTFAYTESEGGYAVADRLVFHSLPAYRTHGIHLLSESRCYDGLEYMDEREHTWLFFRPSRNIAAVHAASTVLEAGTLSAEAWYGPHETDFQLLPFRVYDYDDDGFDDLLALHVSRTGCRAVLRNEAEGTAQPFPIAPYPPEQYDSATLAADIDRLPAYLAEYRRQLCLWNPETFGYLAPEELRICTLTVEGSMHGLHPADGLGPGGCFLGEREAGSTDLIWEHVVDAATGATWPSFAQVSFIEGESVWEDVSDAHRAYYTTTYSDRLRAEIAELRAMAPTIWVQNGILKREALLEAAAMDEPDPAALLADPAYQVALSLAGIRPGDSIEDAMKLHDLTPVAWEDTWEKGIYGLGSGERLYWAGTGLVLSVRSDGRIGEVHLFDAGYDTPDGGQVGNPFDPARSMLRGRGATLILDDRDPTYGTADTGIITRISLVMDEP